MLVETHCLCTAKFGLLACIVLSLLRVLVSLGAVSGGVGTVFRFSSSRSLSSSKGLGIARSAFATSLGRQVLTVQAHPLPKWAVERDSRRQTPCEYLEPKAVRTTDSDP